MVREVKFRKKTKTTKNDMNFHATKKKKQKKNHRKMMISSKELISLEFLN